MMIYAYNIHNIAAIVIIVPIFKFKEMSQIANEILICLVRKIFIEFINLFLI